MKVTSRAALASGLAAGTLLVRRQQLRWGATREEVGAGLPGDDIIPNACLTATRAISIPTPPQQVWPWIVQLGQGRGGFYTYDLLENVVGCDIHSAVGIVPEWQHLEVGDSVRLHPTLGLEVAAVDPPRSLVLRGAAADGDRAMPYDFTWAFVVRTTAAGATRLVVRERYAYQTWWAPLMAEPVEAISFVMTQKMLRGIRDRAVTLASSELPVPSAPGVSPFWAERLLLEMGLSALVPPGGGGHNPKPWRTRLNLVTDRRRHDGGCAIESTDRQCCSRRRHRRRSSSLGWSARSLRHWRREPPSAAAS